MSSFQKKQALTLATRRRTAQRHKQTAAADKAERLCVPAPKGFSEIELVRARKQAPPHCVQEICVVADASRKREVLVEYLKDLRLAEKSARQKTRVLVFCSNAKTCRSLEALVGKMIAKKTPSRGHQRRCGGGKEAGGAATRTAYENKDAATMQESMQLGYVKQICREFKQGKIVTIFATDGATKELASQAAGIGLVVRHSAHMYPPPACSTLPNLGLTLLRFRMQLSLDPPENVTAYRLRAGYAMKPGAKCVLFSCGTVTEATPEIDAIMGWKAAGGAVLPAKVGLARRISYL